MHLVVFDIDGTLVDSGSFETELYVRAIKTVLQIVIEDDWNHYRNVTDGGILDQAIADNGII
jgi:beta-phosphoglucomutase-like phosphatase (HAD superfamily)